MNPRQSKTRSRLFAVVSAFVSLTVGPIFPADPPRPTPRPGTLGAYAGTITLNRSAVDTESGRIVLTNASVADLGDTGTVTLGVVAVTANGASSKQATAGDRAKWQAKHRRQRRVIEGLERRRSLLEINIDHLEDQQLTPKNLVRLELAESKLRHLDGEIARARREMARIVRDARRHGAEPEWFR